MPLVGTYGPNVELWTREKQQNEQELAQKLYEVFDSGVAITKVRGVISAAVDAMVEDGASSAAKSAVGEEGSLEVWKKSDSRMAGLPSLADIAAKLRDPRHQRLFSATNCADLIRLVGCWIEKGGGFAGYKDFNLAHRPGVVAGDASPSSRNQSQVWDQKGANAPRSRGKGWAVEGHLADSVPPVRRLVPSAFYGMKGKRANLDSTVLKIDRMFGLLVGADISGTTTDSTLLVEVYGASGSQQLHSGYYLLPAATIVYNLHHTLIEVALALSLNGVLDENYRIGFYRSLTPRGGFPSELDRIPGILDSAESSTKNRHFLIWYDRSVPKGFIQFAKSEAEALRASRLSDGLEVLAHAKKLSPFPTRDEVFGMVKALAPQLHAGLGAETSRLRLH
jgi:hypothetical protein